MYLCTTRKGLFLGETKIKDGKFFGLTRDGGGGWYLYGTHAEDIHLPSFQGFVARFEIHDGTVTDWKEVVTGLDNGVHQILLYQYHLYILETYIQRVTKVSTFSWEKEFIYPLPRAISSWYFVNGLEGSFEDYVHMNALTVQDDRFYISCPQLRNKIEEGKPTQDRITTIIKVFSSDWKLIDEFNTGRYFCHDLVFVGHEIYFADATNAICKINIVTKEVTEVWTVDPVSPDCRRICRGLSIAEDGVVLVGTHDFKGNSYVVNVLEKKHVRIEDTPCCLARLDVLDYNDPTCLLRTSQVVCVRNHLTEAIYPELVKALDENQRDPTELGDLGTFLNPDFKTDREDFTPGKQAEHLHKLDVLKNKLPASLHESGRFYLYPSGHGMGWHTNRDNIINDEGQLNYRMYTVHATGESYFLYRHTVSGKVHAVRDVDGTSFVFNLLAGLEPFWHAVMCKTGTRLSYGFKFGKETLHNMSLPNIWDIEEPEPEFTFKFAKVNNNLTDYYKFDKGFSIELCADLRLRLQDVALIDGVIGKGVVSKDTRVSKVYWLPKTQKFLDAYSKMFELVGHANDVFFNFRLDAINSNIQYTVYDSSSSGFYGWHIDVGPQNSCRKLSVVVQLSDPSEYEGGELQIWNGGKNPKVAEKEQGAVIIFPSYILHQVTAVTKGTRRSLVLWVDGPPFA
jgi:PKHD-type hydroxylase